jgi:hypothetical protein
MTISKVIDHGGYGNQPANPAEEPTSSPNHSPPYQLFSRRSSIISSI